MGMIRKSFHTKGPDSPAMIELDAVGRDDPRVFRLQQIPGLLIIRMMAKLSGGGSDDENSEIATTFEDFLQQAIVPEQWEEFEAYLLDPENHVDLSTLQDIAAYIVEVASGKAVPLAATSGPG